MGRISFLRFAAEEEKGRGGERRTCEGRPGAILDCPEGKGESFDSEETLGFMREKEAGDPRAMIFCKSFSLSWAATVNCLSNLSRRSLLWAESRVISFSRDWISFLLNIYP